LVEAGKKAQNQLPLNTEAFWKKKADDVAAEDVFFHEVLVGFQLGTRVDQSFPDLVLVAAKTLVGVIIGIDVLAHEDDSDGGVIFNDESDVPSDEEMAEFSEPEEAAPSLKITPPSESSSSAPSPSSSSEPKADSKSDMSRSRKPRPPPRPRRRTRSPPRKPRRTPTTSIWMSPTLRDRLHPIPYPMADPRRCR
jgi:hypothetical protein